MSDINQWKANLLAAKTKNAMPIVTYPGLQITGEKVIDLVTKPEVQANCIRIIADKYPTIAGVMVMDLSVEAEAFGSSVIFAENEIPTVKDRIVSDAESIEKLVVPKFGVGRTSKYVEAARIAKQAVKNKPIFGDIIGPYSLAGRLFDITEIMTHVLIDPDSAKVLLQKSCDFLIDYAKAYKSAGIDGIVIAEPAAGLLPEEMCHDFSSVYVKQIVDAVQDDTFLVILHNCGNTVPLVPTMLSTGAAGLHFGNAIDMMDILPQIPSNILTFGNLDPVSVFKIADSETVYKKTIELLEKTKDFPNFIISSGCDIPPGSPLQNLDSFFNAVNDFYN